MIGEEIYGKLVNQFILTKNINLVPHQWDTKQIHGWVLGHHFNLPIVELVCKKVEATLGFIIGYPVFDSAMLSDYYYLSGDEPDLDKMIEDEIFKKLSGRFLCIYITKKTQRIYLDATGSLAALFSAQYGCVCSSTAVLGLTNSSSSFNDYVKQHQLQWLFFGKTQFGHIRRIIPNHYLDLENWMLHRHYPKPNQFQHTVGLKESIQIISDEIKKMGTALSAKGLYMSLTAGADCRLVMASLRPVVNQITFINNPINFNKMDEAVAGELIERFNLRHLSLNGVRAATPTEVSVFAQILGYTNSTLRELPESVDVLNPQGYHITGVNGELAKGKLYNEGDFENTSAFTIEDLLLRFGVTSNSELLEDAKMQLSPLIGNFTNFQILDLILIEQFFGCLSGPETYPYDAFTIPSIHAFSGRILIETIIGLDSAYKFRKRLTVDACKQLWPDLLQVEINGKKYD